MGALSGQFLSFVPRMYPQQEYSGRAYASARVTDVVICVVMVAGLFSWAVFWKDEPAPRCWFMSYLIILMFLREMKSPSVEFSRVQKTRSMSLFSYTLVFWLSVLVIQKLRNNL